MTVDIAAATLMLSTTTAVPAIMGAFTDDPSDIITGSADPARLGELRRGAVIGAGVSLGLVGLLASASPSGDARRLVLVVGLTMVAVLAFEQRRALAVSPRVAEG